MLIGIGLAMGRSFFTGDFSTFSISCDGLVLRGIGKGADPIDKAKAR